MYEAKWKKSYLKGYILYEFTYIMFWKGKTRYGGSQGVGVGNGVENKGAA